MVQKKGEIGRGGSVSFHSGGQRSILALAPPDLEATVPPELPAEPDTYRGHDGIRRYFQSFQDAMDEIRFQPERFWDEGASVVALVRITAKGRQTAISVEQRI